MPKKQPDLSQEILTRLAAGDDVEHISRALGIDIALCRAEIDKAISVPSSPRAARRLRIEQLTATLKTCDPKRAMSVLRMLCKLDGSTQPTEVTLYEEVWALIGRLDDWQLTEVGEPRQPKSDTERRIWRAKLQRLKRLLCQADDHVAAFRQIPRPPAVIVIDGSDEKIGAMSQIQLYAQRCAALALEIGATNPTASPGQRAEAVSKIVLTLGANHNNAEQSEWADKAMEMAGKSDGT